MLSLCQAYRERIHVGMLCSIVGGVAMGLMFKPEWLQAASHAKPDGKRKNGGRQPRHPKESPAGSKAPPDRKGQPRAYGLKVRHHSAGHLMSRDVLKSVVVPLVISVGLSILAVLMAVLVFMQLA